MVAYLLLCVTGLFIYAGNPLFWSLAASFRTGAAGAATIALINTIAQFALSMRVRPSARGAASSAGSLPGVVTGVRP